MTDRQVFATLLAAAVTSLVACGRDASDSSPLAAAGAGATSSPVPAQAPARAAASAPAGSYSTSFDLAENPISEGGKWSNNGMNWTQVRTADGIAFGSNGITNTYDDSYAYLSGFSADQQGEATVYRSPTLIGKPHEVELLLRWADSPGNARGYECLTNHLGAVHIVRWNGRFADFTVLGDGSVGRALVSGDVIKANVIGNVISVYVNGALIVRVKDSVWRTGQPGIGFFRRTQGASPDLAFTNYMATSLH